MGLVQWEWPPLHPKSWKMLGSDVYLLPAASMAEADPIAAPRSID